MPIVSTRAPQVYLPVPSRSTPDRYSTALADDYMPNFSPYGPGMGGLGDVVNDALGDLGDGSGIAFVDSTISQVMKQLDDISMAMKICMAASVIAGAGSLILLMREK